MNRYALLSPKGHVIATARGTTPQDICECFSRMCSSFERIDTGERWSIVKSKTLLSPMGCEPVTYLITEAA